MWTAAPALISSWNRLVSTSGFCKWYMVCQISCFRVPSHAKETRMGHFGLTKTEKNCENGSILHTKRVEICIELSSYKACNHLKPAKTPKTSQNFAQKFNLANR